MGDVVDDLVMSADYIRAPPADSAPGGAGEGTELQPPAPAALPSPPAKQPKKQPTRGAQDPGGTS